MPVKQCDKGETHVNNIVICDYALLSVFTATRRVFLR